MTNVSTNQLPEGWEFTNIGEICSEINSGSGFPKQHQGYASGDYPFAKVGDISRHFRGGQKKIKIADHYLSENIRAKIKAKIFPKNTIVFPKIGEALKNNYRVITDCEMLFDNNVMGLTPHPTLIDCKFIFYFLTTQDFGKFSVATTVPSVRRGDIESIQLLLPPLNEQKRIVAKIEELFSELDNGIAALNAARKQLKVYRQSVLKHAFEGKLTAKWREENADKLETQEQLLARIQQERDARYQQQLKEWKTAIKKWETKGKKGKKISKPSAIKAFGSLTESIVTHLPKIPNNWHWGKLGNLTTGVGYGTSNKSSESGLVPVIRMGNLQNGKIDWSDLAYSNDNEDIQKYSLKPGDILFNRTNSPELVGKTAKYRGEKPAIFAGYLIRINQIDSIVVADYLNYFLNSHFAKQYSNTVKTDGVNQSNINGQKLQNYPFPFCSIAEQMKIVELLEEKLSVTDLSIQDIDFQLSKTETLRESILKKALSGKLVPQNPNDEPASKLLERIKTEKTTPVTARKPLVKKRQPMGAAIHD